MNKEPILDINKLSNYINEIKNKYNISMKVDTPEKNFFSDTILKLIEKIIVKQTLYDKVFWNKYNLVVDESAQIKKIIKSIESKKDKRQSAYGYVYKVKSNLFINKKFDIDTVAVKIEKINLKFFLIDKLINSIKIAKYASKIKIGPKLYDTFVMIDNDNDIKIIKIYKYIDGIPFSDKKWKSKNEKEEILDKLRKIIRKMNKAGIIHHDIHKGNIMITKSNKIYITNFDKSNFINDDEQKYVNYMNNNYSSPDPHIVSTKLINFIYNNCINDGIIIIPT